MRLRREFLRLPWRFDPSELAAEIDALPASAWREHPQKHPGNTAVPLVAANGDATDDATCGPMRPTPHLASLPYLRQVMGAFESVIGRSRLMRLRGQAEATPHVDTNYYWADRLRIHVPIRTHPSVVFTCGTQHVHMAAGETWVFDTSRIHNVHNDAQADRIHLVIDTVVSPTLRAALEGTREHFDALPYREDFEPALRFEGSNQPVVMTPWELRHRFDEALAWLPATVPADLARSLRADLDAAFDAWRGVYAEHGDAPSGWPLFAERLRALETRLAAWPALRQDNGTLLAEAVRQWVVRAALNPALAKAASMDIATMTRPSSGMTADTGPLPPVSSTATALGHTAPSIRRDATNATARDAAGSIASDAADPEPTSVASNANAAARPAIRGARNTRRDAAAAAVFIVCPPRSGGSRLLEAFAQAPRVALLRGDAHGVLDGLPELQLAQRRFDSHRLFARDATPAVASAVRQRLLEHLHDRDGRGPGTWTHDVRAIAYSARNALRVAFLAEVFPDAQFVYLYRDARETLSAMLDAWRNGRHVSAPDLPDWKGPPWSLPVVSGWREWNDAPLPALVARQWAGIVRHLLDDLDALAPERWCLASYDRLVEQPTQEIARLRDFLQLPWDERAQAALARAPAAHSPAPGTWQHNAEDLERAMPLAAAQAERAYRLFAAPPATRVPARRAHAALPVSPAKAPTDFASVHAGALPELLAATQASLAISTYQSGRIVLLRQHDGHLNTHLCALPKPMGIARRGRELAIGTLSAVWRFGNQPALAAALPPRGQHDACFVPLRSHVTGDIRVHEMAYADDGLWIANTRFSCLARLDEEHSFVPAWRPRFITALAAEDRCHLNGIALRDGRVDCVSVLGESDAPAGWRERKADGGALIDVASGETIVRGLCMPHSPRWHGGHLYVLESGKGSLARIDAADGHVETLLTLPGFTRGLAFAGRYAFIGLSQTRETVFDGLPIARAQSERRCGVWVVDVPQGKVVGFLRFEGEVREIFDVQLLDGLRYPELLEPDDPRVASSFVLPAAALAN